MVLQGQYLERPALIQRGDLTLEGLYHRGAKAPGLVVCAPHPRMGGSMDSPVVAELAWALTRRGHATLRFNYEGVGASGGTVRAGEPDAQGARPLSVLEHEVVDAEAALALLGESVAHRRLAIAGYSFGAGVALATFLKRPELTHLLLVAPPTGLFSFEALGRLDRPVFIGVGGRDPWTDRALLAQAIDGNPNVHVELLEGAEHTFVRGLTELGRAAADWLSRQSRP